MPIKNPKNEYFEVTRNHSLLITITQEEKKRTVKKNGPLRTVKLHYHYTFYSDASGSNFRMQNSMRINYNKAGDRGVCCLGIYQDSSVWWWTRMLWPLIFINDVQDFQGHYYGSKIDTLESIGLLLPLLCIPKLLQGKNILFHVDNTSVVNCWNNFYYHRRNSTTLILYAVRLISMYLDLNITVSYVPRLSNKWSILADHLSRYSTTSQNDIKMIENAKINFYKGVLYQWLRDPEKRINLPAKLLAEVRAVIE